MRALIVLGFLALGILLVAANHQDQSESGLEAKNERSQGDFAHGRGIRSTGGKKKTRITRKPTPGVFSTMSRPSGTREKRQSEDSTPQKRKPKKCIGCYSFSILTHEQEIYTPRISLRQQRDTEETEKLKKKQKHLKEKGRGKGRRHKNHRERHAHFQEEDPESDHNNKKRRKHHRGKKDREHVRVGAFTALSFGRTPMQNRDIQERIE